MGYSPWGHKELDTTERLNNSNHDDVLRIWPPFYGMLPLCSSPQALLPHLKSSNRVLTS